jgi:hypothetical protein
MKKIKSPFTPKKWKIRSILPKEGQQERSDISSKVIQGLINKQKAIRHPLFHRQQKEIAGQAGGETLFKMVQNLKELTIS